MLTNEQKAEAWDGLKEAMNHMTKDASQVCKKMASEFLALMQQVESKVESEQKQSVKCLECTKHMFCELPERKVAIHQCKDFLRNSSAVLPHEPMADMIEDILNTLQRDRMIKDINTAWVSRHIVIEMSKRGVFVEL